MCSRCAMLYVTITVILEAMTCFPEHATAKIVTFKEKGVYETMRNKGEPVAEQIKRPNESVAIIVSGMDTRLVEVATNSLMNHVISPHVKMGFKVDVFMVMQSQPSVHLLRTVDQHGMGVSRNVERISKQEKYFRECARKVGANIVEYKIEPAPSFQFLQREYNLKASSPLKNSPQGLWVRNLMMYHNILRGFHAARFHSNYTYYVRTRTDNVYFKQHPLYSSFKGAEAVMPSCRASGGYNDKFAIFKSMRAAAAFF
eukprot:gb/GECG01009429.1/.p1 GENE.gb/GECG01009429.1/~~gb/GECG01009429.1/.p1  ORF type:complete len:257 (+),score=19.74 gb/GECG01009429.1/:1-771(+)